MDKMGKHPFNFSFLLRRILAKNLLNNHEKEKHENQDAEPLPEFKCLPNFEEIYNGLKHRTLQHSPEGG